MKMYFHHRSPKHKLQGHPSKAMYCFQETVPMHQIHYLQIEHYPKFEHLLGRDLNLIQGAYCPRIERRSELYRLHLQACLSL